METKEKTVKAKPLPNKDVLEAARFELEKQRFELEKRKFEISQHKFDTTKYDRCFEIVRYFNDVQDDKTLESNSNYEQSTTKFKGRVLNALEEEVYNLALNNIRKILITPTLNAEEETLSGGQVMIRGISNL